MKCIAIVDTNVLVSALLSRRNDTATVLVVGRMLAGEIVPAYSEAIMAEYRQVLRRQKFGFDSSAVHYLLSAIERFGMLVEPLPSGLTLPDMKDLPFYEVVLEKQDECAYLVTGNLKHFPKQPFVVTARQLLDILDGR